MAITPRDAYALEGPESVSGLTTPVTTTTAAPSTAKRGFLDFGLTDAERDAQLQRTIAINNQAMADLQAKRAAEQAAVNQPAPMPGYGPAPMPGYGPAPMMGNTYPYDIPNRNFTWQTTPQEQVRIAGNLGRSDLGGLLATGEYGPLAGQQYQYRPQGVTDINYGPGGSYGGFGGGYGWPGGSYGWPGGYPVFGPGFIPSGPPTGPTGTITTTDCFIDGVQVELADGSEKNVSEISVGDVVKTEAGDGSVVKVFHSKAGKQRLYGFNDKDPFVTEAHPFMTQDGWKKVSELEVGDTLYRNGLGLDTVKSIDSKEIPEDTPVYNFHVDKQENYYADGYLVHNKTYSPTTPSPTTTTIPPWTWPDETVKQVDTPYGKQNLFVRGDDPKTAQYAMSDAKFITDMDNLFAPNYSKIRSGSGIYDRGPFNLDGPESTISGADPQGQYKGEKFINRIGEGFDRNVNEDRFIQETTGRPYVMLNGQVVTAGPWFDPKSEHYIPNAKGQVVTPSQAAISPAAGRGRDTDEDARLNAALYARQQPASVLPSGFGGREPANMGGAPSFRGPDPSGGSFARNQAMDTGINFQPILANQALANRAAQASQARAAQEAAFREQLGFGTSRGGPDDSIPDLLPTIPAAATPRAVNTGTGGRGQKPAKESSKDKQAREAREAAKKAKDNAKREANNAKAAASNAKSHPSSTKLQAKANSAKVVAQKAADKAVTAQVNHLTAISKTTKGKASGVYTPTLRKVNGRWVGGL